MIYITGDTHGEFHRFSTKYIKFEKDDFVIITGDFGGIWESANSKRLATENYWLSWLNDKLFTTVICQGNHENMDRLYSEFDLVEFNGGLAYKIRDNIYIVKNGETITLEDNKFVFLGGAYSIDKASRIEGVSWWHQEEMEYTEMKNILEKLEDTDYVISHTAPISIIKKYFNIAEKFDRTSQFLEEVMNKIKFKHWYFGHFHENRSLGDKFTILYQVIDAIKISK